MSYKNNITNLQQTILIVSNSCKGGTNTFVKSFTKHQSRLGQQFQIQHFQLQSIHKQELNYYRIAYTHLIRLVYECILLIRIIRQIKPVIIIGIDTHVNLIIAIAYFILRKKFYPILTFHNNVEMVFALKLKKNSWLIRYICKCIFNKISTIIAVSEGVKSNIANYFNLKNIKVIHIGISLRYYSSNESNNLKKLGKKNDVIILSAGRLEPQKDFDTVIDSVYSLRNKVTGIKLLIIGSGSEKQRLQKKVSDLSMDNIVQFIEWTDNLHEYFKICSIYVLSSHYEGFPYTLIEAMASKIPVIASDCNYGPDEILQHGKYGRLIPPQNTKAMSQAILDTIKQKKKTKEFVEKGYRRSKKFSEASMIKCYARLFRQILMHNP